jgi:osmotically-inducible protein OsmY
MKLLNGVLLGALFVIGTCVSLAQDQRPAPDNTKVNKSAQPTADQAKNNTSDRNLMQQIRKAIEEDHSLSTNAHNVKVIAKNGHVTLKGPVDSEDEKKTVGQKAIDAAGASNVTNGLTVKASHNHKTSS